MLAERKMKRVCESQTEQVQVVMPPHLNGYGKLFGGQLAMWIDILAGIVARRHCEMAITTASIDNLRFRASVSQNALVILKGKMTYVGTTSMEVRVDSYIENDAGEQRLINTAFVTQVGLDEYDKPCRVPGLVPCTPEEEKEFEAGSLRRDLRQKALKGLFD